MSKPRILLLDHTAEPGGAELALLRVVSVLHPQTDVRVLLFAHGPLVERFRSIGVQVAVKALDKSVATASRDEVAAGLGHSAISALRFLPSLSRAIRGAHADLVVANSLKSAAFAFFAAPLAGRRWVWHLHDRLSADYLPRSLLTAMRMIAVWGPRGIVVNSQATLDTLPRLARKKASIAYPGLPASAFEAASPVMPRTIGLIGRISPTKGQHEFLDAAAKLAPEFPDVKFQVVGAALFGEDDYEADVRSLARTLGIGERTEFTGWVSDAPVVLRRLSVLLHASPVPEPFGQVIVEGMAAGVPVVATAAGGVTEILDPAGRYALGGRPFRITETGVLVRPGDPSALAGAIRLVLGDPEASAARAALARDDARHRFGIEETASVVATAWAEAMR